MNSPNLKHTAPGGATPGSGQGAHEAQQQTTPLYRQNPRSTTIPFISDSLIEREYWQHRASDCLYRAWTYYRQGDRAATDKALHDFFNSNSRQQDLQQEQP